MRSLPNDIPCNLVLVREPEQDTVPRHMRLPSYGAMVTKQRDEERLRDLLAWQSRCRKEGLKLNATDPAIQRFNGNNDSHITEADCRKLKISGNTVGTAIANGINAAAISAFVNTGAWKGESLVEAYERAQQRAQMRAVADWAQRMLAAKEPQQPKASPVTQERVKQILWGDERKEADPEGWIRHDGKGCPLPSGTICEIRKFNGEQATVTVGPDLHSSYWDGWKYVGQGDGFDIVAYRLLG